MDKTTIEKLSSTILWAAGILAASLVFSASTTSSKVGRYTFMPEREHWVLVGDTKTGRSWSCTAKAVYEEGVKDNADFAPGFDGCHEMSVPSKIQKRVAYETRGDNNNY